jgi:hypothetical protein
MLFNSLVATNQLNINEYNFTVQIYLNILINAIPVEKKF